jgi:ParB family chromosome partitioning protein
MRLCQLEISKIQPNPDNPRGIDIQTEDEKLSYLKDSIRQFGVMVPIVVSQHGDNYLLIDGERRYWASLAVSWTKN